MKLANAMADVGCASINYIIREAAKRMNRYKSKRNVTLVIDMIAIVLSFVISLAIRYTLLVDNLGSMLVVTTYEFYFTCALILYVIFSLLRRKLPIERMSYREIILNTIEGQIIFIATYIFLFYVMHKEDTISRIVLGLFFVLNVIFISLARILYHIYCVKKEQGYDENYAEATGVIMSKSLENTELVRHCYVVGAKSVGLYGGFESFIMNLLQQHKDNKNIKYHVACKANGEGYMDLSKLDNYTSINENEFTYCNAHCFLVRVPEKLGSAQAIFYDIRALKWCCEHIEKNHIEEPIVYILASRIGPFEKKYVNRIHAAGGRVYQNPDGHEDWRAKWSPMIRKYWKLSESFAVKYADLVVCDSKSIENYIKEEYSQYKPQTTFIAYGSYINSSSLTDDNPKYTGWLASHNLRDRQFYIIVGRFVPENNFETIIREFMLSNSNKDLAIITTRNEKLLKEINQRIHFKQDKRIKFVGTVYDTELLTKIRENAYGYFHGHSVGGTNPSLLEALGATKLNLLYDVGFNREVAEDAALYWSLDAGNLAKLIDTVDKLGEKKVNELGRKAKQRIKDEYNWEYICDKYEKVFRSL